MANTSRIWEVHTPEKDMEALCCFPHTLPYASLPFDSFFGVSFTLFLSKRKRRKKEKDKEQKYIIQIALYILMKFEAVVKIYLWENVSGPDGLASELNQIFKEELAPTLHVCVLCVCVKSLELCPTLCDPVDYSR